MLKEQGESNVRIHVKRVIRLLQRKYTIVESTLPINILTSNSHGATEVQVPLIDHNYNQGLLWTHQPLWPHKCIVPFD